MPKKTTRVQLELPEGSFERLKALREVTETASYAEVIRNALRLYEGLIKEAESGNALCVKTPEGEEYSYKYVFEQDSVFRDPSRKINSNCQLAQWVRRWQPQYPTPGSDADRRPTSDTLPFYPLESFPAMAVRCTRLRQTPLYGDQSDKGIK